MSITSTVLKFDKKFAPHALFQYVCGKFLAMWAKESYTRLT